MELIEKELAQLRRYKNLIQLETQTCALTILLKTMKKRIHVIVSLYKSKPLVLLFSFTVGFKLVSTKNHEYVTVELVRDTIALIPEK